MPLTPRPMPMPMDSTKEGSPMQITPAPSQTAATSVANQVAQAIAKQVTPQAVPAAILQRATGDGDAVFAAGKRRKTLLELRESLAERA